MPLLAINDTDVMSDINNVLDVGLEVIVPQRVPAKAVGVSGIGYMLRDPVTEAAAYRISGGLNGGAGEAPCAVRELRPLTQAIQDIVLTALVLAAAAALVTVGPAAPPVAALMAGVGLGALTFEATAGEFCNPIPEARIGGSLDTVHQVCADTRTNNTYVGFDVCLSDGNESKKFDAYSKSGNKIWEVKTYNFDNTSDPLFLPTLDKPEWEKESRIARSCGVSYIYTVGDNRHVQSLNILQTEFVPNVADDLEVDSANCLQQKK